MRDMRNTLIIFLIAIIGAGCRGKEYQPLLDSKGKLPKDCVLSYLAAVTSDDYGEAATFWTKESLVQMHNTEEDIGRFTNRCNFYKSFVGASVSHAGGDNGCWYVILEMKGTNIATSISCVQTNGEWRLTTISENPIPTENQPQKAIK